MTDFLGAPTDIWNLLLAVVNTLILAVGVPFAVHSLRQSNAQRKNDSMTKLLEEYRGADFRDSVRQVIASVPIFPGDLDERTRAFLEHGRKHLKRDDLLQARAVVHKLNDLGVLVERNSVRESDFFGHTHPRIIEIGTRLDPLILCVSARNSRWGMRVRRLRIGAEGYYRHSPFYNRRDFVIDGHVLVPAGIPTRRARLRKWWLERRGRLSLLPMGDATLQADDADMKVVAAIMSTYNEGDLKFLDSTA